MNYRSAAVDFYDDKLDIFFSRLEAIFEEMDRKYNEVAESYGFKCRGCEDNCCLTRFYHHTHLEYLYVRRGFDNLDPLDQGTLLTRALEVCRQAEMADKKGLPVRQMCPLNQNGMCAIYHYRPMICRMHGIPHELRKPGRSAVHGPGCGDFDHQHPGKSYVRFDRTPFYFEMARLENEFKQVAGLSGRIKLTIAEMIMRDETHRD
jgi:Fe-S-cluster containining protein